MNAATLAAVIWEHGPLEGSVEVSHGTLARMEVAEGEGRIEDADFHITTSGPCRLLIECADAATGSGANATRVTLNAGANPFTFFLRDVTREFPVYIPEYGVIVTRPDDTRGFAEIAESIAARGLDSGLSAVENASEETYEAACARNRDQICPTWLGLSRDMRLFEVGYAPREGFWGYVQPRYHSTVQNVPETEGKPYRLAFTIGPGASCRYNITRRLEDGYLPILHSTQSEDDIRYELTIFVTLETQPLSSENLRGSDWRACYANTGGNMLSKEDKEGIRDLLDEEMRGREEETLCWIRIEARNSGSVPRYAWLRGLHVTPGRGPAGYDGRTGFGRFESGRVFGVHLLDGAPAPEREMAILIQPGRSVTYDILIPHQPVPEDRAGKMATLDFGTHIEACRKFWKGKLDRAASISLPEPAVDERVKAGLLHCDLVALGKESDGPVLATIGWYAPIGSESSPIIQFFDAMGCHGLAERCLDFFLDRQREDGFIQNFGGYQLETGPALWSMGEHYRYTRDRAWVERVRPRVLKACDYLLAWRERNKREELRGRGYGLLDGKVADPEDFFHSFMLNGLSYLGIKRAAEMLAGINPVESERLAREAEEFRDDIRAAYYEAVGRSPVVPLGDGTWVSSVPPWAEYPGALALYADGGDWFTHGAFGARDSLIGSLYLVISEVLDPDEAGTDVLLRSHQQLFTVENAGLTQPYYCRHDHIHLRRGEVKPFLKTYYNQFTALQDRETYTFWEHYFHVSQHKTHEEGWFLMQTRWMLLMEEGDTLHMLRAIPRAWMADGKRLAFDGMATYFGPVSLQVNSRAAGGVIEAEYAFAEDRRPKRLVIRLPHHAETRPDEVNGGKYDPLTESVEILNPPAKGSVSLRFGP